VIAHSTDSGKGVSRVLCVCGHMNRLFHQLYAPFLLLFLAILFNSSTLELFAGNRILFSFNQDTMFPLVHVHVGCLLLILEWYEALSRMIMDSSLRDCRSWETNFERTRGSNSHGNLHYWNNKQKCLLRFHKSIFGSSMYDHVPFAIWCLSRVVVEYLLGPEQWGTPMWFLMFNTDGHNRYS
jgi:hypothetical protein